MLEVQITNYANRKTEAYCVTLKTDVKDLDLYFSYETCIAFSGAEGVGGMTTQKWGPTTGRHKGEAGLYVPDLAPDVFEENLQEALAEVLHSKGKEPDDTAARYIRGIIRDISFDPDVIRHLDFKVHRQGTLTIYVSRGKGKVKAQYTYSYKELDDWRDQAFRDMFYNYVCYILNGHGIFDKVWKQKYPPTEKEGK